MKNPACAPAYRHAGACLHALLLVLAAYSLPAQAGRPLATDDAAIVEPGACQLEAWSEHGRDHRAVWLNPACNPLGRSEFAFGGARLRPDGAPASTLHAWQIKRMLRDYDHAQAGLALALGGRQHDGTHEHVLNGIATFPLGNEAHLVHVNLGGLRTRAAGSRQVRATWGLAYDTEVAAATRLSLESFGTSGERPGWQLGVRHEFLSGHLQLDASVGGTFGRWSETRHYSLGLVLVSPASSD